MTQPRLILPRLKLVLLAVFAFASCSPTRGCIESSFTLSEECRLPRWFSVAATGNRRNYEVTLDYWGGPVGRTATVTLKDKHGWWALDSVIVTTLGKEPLTTAPKPKAGPIPYPLYEVLTARGITEVVEHRRMEPVFYIVDDADVKKNLGVR